LTQTGLDESDDYEVDGETCTAVGYMQFINAGDLRVSWHDRSCRACYG
jgi:hypothetical protein